MKKNNLRKGILVASSLILAAAISVGATLAYLTANTDTKNNVFTAGGGITIKLEEPIYEKTKKTNRIPGEEFTKDPQVHNTSGESPVYTVMSLEYLIDDVRVDYDTFTNSANNENVVKYVTIKTDDAVGFNTSKWEQLTDTDAKLDFFVYGKKNAPTSVAADVSTDPIFNKVVISKADKAGTVYKINARAYAVNADGGVTADVFTELASLTGGKITANVTEDGASFN